LGLMSFLYLNATKPSVGYEQDIEKYKKIISNLEAQLRREKEVSKGEREGRIKHQIALASAQTKLRTQTNNAESNDNLSESSPKDHARKPSSLTVSSIGFITSSYSTRNGTPRQPSLATKAKSKLTLYTTRIPPISLKSLASFNHVWLIFHFHQNTNAHKLDFKATIKPPRLNGTSLGVFATRSPHRPNPIGLSLAKIVRVDESAGEIFFEGLDLVNGTPILDIKPYVAFSDAPSVDEVCKSPWWVVKEVEDGKEPLAIDSVQITKETKETLIKVWNQACKTHSLSAARLYASGDEFVEFVVQNLGMDFRSLRERQTPKLKTYRVTLCDVVVFYEMVKEVTSEAIVTITGAELISEKTVQPLNEIE
jgi:tRNA (adenine37-N6)-methyltransferase